MKPEYENIPLIKNDAEKQFEITVDGHKGSIVYKETPHQYYLVHTEVEPALEGRGAATALIEKTLDYIEKEEKKLTPLCPLVFTYIKRHPDWKRLIDENFMGFHSK